MDELKTLKDIETEITADNGFSDLVCSSKVLKQEAIKLINFLDEKDCENEMVRELVGGGCTSCSEGVGICNKDSVVNFIEKFFNITEEDLNDQKN